jgi:hypothetical protein
LKPASDSDGARSRQLRITYFVVLPGFREEIFTTAQRGRAATQSDYLAQRRKGRKGKRIVISTKGRNLS